MIFGREVRFIVVFCEYYFKKTVKILFIKEKFCIFVRFFSYYVILMFLCSMKDDCILRGVKLLTFVNGGGYICLFDVVEIGYI